MERHAGRADFNEGELDQVAMTINLPFVQLFAEKLAPPLPDDILLSTTAESFRQEFFHLYDFNPFNPQRRIKLKIVTQRNDH